MPAERESYFNAATPGSVAFPAAPITGKSSLSPFRYEHRDNHVIVFDVPLMDEHEDSSRRKPFDKFSGQLFDDVVRATREFESKGAYVQIIIGHTEGEGDDEFSHPVVGHIRNVRSKGKSGKRQIIGDMWFSPESFENQIKTNKYPRRSAEISRLDKRLDPVALLGASTPARPLPDMLFQAPADSHELYMASHPNVGDEDMDPVLEAIKAIDEKFTKRFEAIEKFQDDAKPGDDDDEAKKKKKEEADAAEKEKNKKKDGYDADGNKIPDDDKDKDKSARSQADKEMFAGLRNNIETLTTSVKALADENATLRVERITDEIDSKVVYFRRVGIELGDKEKVEKFKKSLAKLDSTERQERYDEIEEHWNKVPVAVSIDRTGLLGDNTDAAEGPVSEEAKQTILAMKYSDKHGITMAEAANVLQTQGVAALETYKRDEGAAPKLQY